MASHNSGVGANRHHSPKRLIDIQREQLALQTEQFLARGGQITELPAYTCKVVSMPSRHVDLRSSAQTAARKREERALQILELQRAGMNVAEIAHQLGVDRGVVTRSLKVRDLC